MRLYNQVAENEINYIWLALRFRGRYAQFYNLLDSFGTADNVILNARDIQKNFPKLLSDRDIQALKTEPPEESIERILSDMRRTGTSIILRYDPDYPQTLTEQPDSPPVLFAKGILPRTWDKAVCVVGSRQYTEYGNKMVMSVVGKLAYNDALIISGLALGTDALAARYAVKYSDAECKTVAVLPCGVDQCYPSANLDLYNAIQEQGLLLSKYAPGTYARDFRFIERNDLMSRLSKCVLFTEGTAKSGALTTARAALKYDRHLFCFPRSDNDPMGVGPNSLIESGKALSVHSGDEILAVMGVRPSDDKIDLSLLQTATPKHKSQGAQKGSQKPAVPSQKAINEDRPFVPEDEQKTKKPELPGSLSGEERLIANALADTDKAFDELLCVTGIEPDKLGLLLTMLEISGIIQQTVGGKYGLCQ